MLRKRTIAVLAGATVAMALVPWRAEADQVILDDLIVDGSACIGLDCVNGESFGFDTLRLKENNLRIHFQDTSNSASFPTADWRIKANDSTNGGDSFLAFEDSDNGTEAFIVEKGAGQNALVVESGGDVGINTGVPVVDLHIVTGNTPTVRLEQDGSSGFTPQTWDLAGNETNFFIRDATNGSTLPFRIRPGAPTSAIDVASDGDVGFGDSSPDTNIDVADSGNVQVSLTSSTSGEEWRFSNNGNNSVFRISLQGNGVQDLELRDGGQLRLAGTCLELGGGTHHISTTDTQVTAGACP